MNPAFPRLAGLPAPSPAERTVNDANLLETIRAHEAQIAGLVGLVQANNAMHGAGPAASEAARQASIARTEFESAFMRLARAVAKPPSPWVPQ